MKTNDQFIIGIIPIIEAIESGKEINKVLLKKGLTSENSAELFHLIRERNIPFQFVPLEKLNRITHGKHQGFIALLSIVEYQNLDEIIQMAYEAGRDPFVLILDELTDVRNFGAIARTAVCAGIDAIVIPLKGSVSITPDAMKTSAGALNHLAVCRELDLLETTKRLKSMGLQIFAATEKGNSIYYETPMTGPVVLVAGSEETGVRPEILRIADKLVKIPLTGVVSSLNVSVATGILCFEIVKQRLMDGKQ